MDLAPLIGAMPQLGGAGVFAAIIAILLRVNMQMGKRHDEELARINSAHDEELRELRETITELRSRTKELEKERQDAARRAWEFEEALYKQKFTPPPGG